MYPIAHSNGMSHKAEFKQRVSHHTRLKDRPVSSALPPLEIFQVSANNPSPSQGRGTA